ncbi:hypothetical protein [Methylorubrum zatmanii]|uniref:Uncharacterized protein n=1 Tax=Methylorubrum zatmanii TaxID=29429 RepID=A0ABW1WL01_9HYPH|nr:hypothetical protein [Methylorubrum zatmanii]MBD8907187.1 hypothetical protein [Methylorubrum zatmanii]
MTRELPPFGWTAQDEARAARIRAERGQNPIIFDEVSTWRSPAPFTVAGADITAAGLRVTLFRPRVLFSTPAREEPPCEG